MLDGPGPTDLASVLAALGAADDVARVLATPGPVVDFGLWALAARPAVRAAAGLAAL
jgi:hypothetical protein